MFDFFQQPWTMLAIGICTLVILWLIRAVVPQRIRWWFFLLPPVVILAGFGLDYLVQTDLETIHHNLGVIATAIENENAEAIEKYISADYSDSIHSSKSYLMGHCRSRLSKPIVKETVLRISSVEFEDDNTAKATFTLRIVFEERAYIYEGLATQVVVEAAADFKQESQRWRITQGRLLKLNGQRFDWSQTNF